MSHADVAVIGGSGVYHMEGLVDTVEVHPDTPFGKPSSKIVIGTFPELNGMRVAFLARHDIGHKLSPTEVPYKANIYALKALGVKYLLSISACGSLQEHAKPMDVVLVDQFIDRTTHRNATFFGNGNGIIAHVAMADPVCHKMRKMLKETIDDLKCVECHDGGVYVCIEGPAFSTKAESNMYRKWDGTVIGMTGVTEAKLAREAEIAYGIVAFVTDYDCWHPSHDSVTVEMVMANLHANAANAQKIIKGTLLKLSQDLFDSEAHHALKYAILPVKDLREEVKENLKHIIGKYVL